MRIQNQLLGMQCSDILRIHSQMNTVPWQAMLRKLQQMLKIKHCFLIYGGRKKWTIKTPKLVSKSEQLEYYLNIATRCKIFPKRTRRENNQHYGHKWPDGHDKIV